LSGNLRSCYRFGFLLIQSVSHWLSDVSNGICSWYLDISGHSCTAQIIFFDILKWILIIGLLVVFVFIGSALLYGMYDDNKKQRIEKEPILLLKENNKVLIPKLVKEQGESNEYLLEVVCPKLNQSVEYKLDLINETYLINKVKLVDAHFPHLKTWQEISQLLKEYWKLESKISEYISNMEKCQKAKQTASFSSIYSKHPEMYEKLILGLQDKIKIGRNLSQKIHEQIREYLIHIELADVNPLNLINTIQNAQEDNENLGFLIQDKHNSLHVEVSSYLEMVNDQLELMESLV
jgi:hypothetical protein